MEQQAEVEALRARVAELERELAERTERANAAVAAAEDRLYWLDRWRIDPNRVMATRPGQWAFLVAKQALRAARDPRQDPPPPVPMSERVTAVVPVKDGARFLGEILDALAREGVDEVLVIDSGSSDGSQADRSRGRRDDRSRSRRTDFGHGRTRNLGADRATGDIVAFLTQDATPAPGWLAAMRAGFALADDVGAVYGPHLRRADTSPMIARELTEFFATFGDRATGLRTRRSDVPLERERRLPARMLGGDPVRRRALQRGPGVRSRARGAPDLAQGVPPGSWACSTRTTTRRWSSCAGTSTSTAACARRSTTSSRSACDRPCARPRPGRCGPAVHG